MNNSTFMGLDIAIRGLYSSQRGLATVSHNVDNANTAGYSRQVIDQRASRPMLVANSAGMLGMGSDVVAVNRVRDEFLDEKFWSEAQYQGEWRVKTELLEDIQTVYNEPSENGYSQIINDYYASLQELSKDPSSLSVRAMVKEKGIMVAKYFNSVATHFDKLQEDVNNMVDAKVQEVNSLADQVRELNLQIFNYEITGNKANDLRDRRTLLTDRLSKIINTQAYEIETGYRLPNGDPEKRFVVTISGKALVDHESISYLKVEQRDTRLNSSDLDNLYDVGWADGNKLRIRSGELKGYMDIRDGNDGTNVGPEYRGVPYYQRRMNEFVQTLSRTLNEGIIDIDGDGTLDKVNGHIDGFKRNSVTGDPPGGIRFFTMKDENGNAMSSADFQTAALAKAAADGVLDDPATLNVNEALVYGYSIVTAKTFNISFDVDSDPSNNIAASDAAGELGNSNNVKSLLTMRHNTYMFDEGSAEDFVKTLIAGLGVDAQQAIMFDDTQSGIVQQVENRRQSISGVSVNEEMANLVKYQQIYGASAKMVTAYEELLDILVNRMV